jgi:hypothetical protein
MTKMNTSLLKPTRKGEKFLKLLASGKAKARGS